MGFDAVCVPEEVFEIELGEVERDLEHGFFRTEASIVLHLDRKGRTGQADVSEPSIVIAEEKHLDIQVDALPADREVGATLLLSLIRFPALMYSRKHPCRRRCFLL